MIVEVRESVISESILQQGQHPPSPSVSLFLSVSPSSSSSLSLSLSGDGRFGETAIVTFKRNHAI